MSSNKESISRVFTVAIVLCVVSALFVAGSVVLLRPAQVANKLLDTQRNILSAAGLYGEGVDAQSVFEKKITVRLVDLRTGELVADAAAAGITSVDAYDQRVATKDPALSAAIPVEKDIAKLRRKANFAKVYLINDDAGQLEKIVLPISGYGLWSTMYGYLVLGNDLNTVVGITFTEHGETPGLGGEVDNPKWKAQWPGKQVYDEAGTVAAHLKKGGVNPDSEADRLHNVDGLAGATLTSNGVNNVIKYWLGEEGFGPFLKKLKAQGV